MEHTYNTPISKVVSDKRVNEILARIQKAVRNGTPLIIPNSDVTYMSRKFQDALIRGEKRLYDLSRIIINNLCETTDVKVDLFVWGRCTNPFHSDVIKKRFSLNEGFTKIVEKSKTETSSKFNLICPHCSDKTPIIASFVQFFPQETHSRETLNFISTRIKTTSNISYKIADMVFGIDRMFNQDKIYGRFAQAVVDIYGLKLVTSTKEDIYTIVDWMNRYKKIKILEEKDYIGRNKKESGFQAYKIITSYNKQVFETQIQSRRMYNEELYNRETSHKTYKENQMSQRRLLGHEYFILYEALNRLFRSPSEISDMDYIELGFGKGRY